MSYQVLKDTLQTYVSGYKWRFYESLNPINFLEGFLADPKGYSIFGTFKTKRDLEDFIQRLKAWTNRTEENKLRMKNAIEMNTTNNWVSEERVLHQLDAINVDPDQFVLYEPFNELLENMTIPSQQKIAFRTNAKEAIKNLLNAYRNLNIFDNSVPQQNPASLGRKFVSGWR